MKFTIDVMPASAQGGATVYLDGARLGSWPVPADGLEAASAEMARRYGDDCEASHRHLAGEPCDICDGTGTDYLGRSCRRLIASR